MRGFPTPSGLPDTSQATSVRPNAPENRPRPGTPVISQPRTEAGLPRGHDLLPYGLRKGDRVRVTIVVDVTLGAERLDDDGDLLVLDESEFQHHIFGPYFPHTIQITKV